MMTETDKTSSKSASSNNVPPPCDPFPTYQTFYPRQPTSNDENPFIQFRRFADAQLSSLVDQFRGFREGNALNRQNYNRDWARRDELQEQVESLRAEAEQLRSDIEQNKRSMHRDGHASIEGGALDDAARWDALAQGMLRCPGVRSEYDGSRFGRTPVTELDLYDQSRSIERPDDPVQTIPAPDCELNSNVKKRGWLSGLGWDGINRIRSNNDTLQASNAGPANGISQGDNSREDERGTLGWLVLSDYSPLYLQSISSSTHPSRQNKQQCPNWIEAFEDLLLVADRHDPWVRDFDSIRKSHERGADGTQASQAMSVEPMAEVSQDRDADFWKFLEKASSDMGSELVSSLEDAVLGAFDLLLGSTENTVSFKARGGSSVAAQQESSVGSELLDPEQIVRHIKHAQRQANNDVEDSEHSGAVASSPQCQLQAPQFSAGTIQHGPIISSLTEIRTRTLPDGSVETRRVLKQRFADGSEEGNETIEIQHRTVQPNARTKEPPAARDMSECLQSDAAKANSKPLGSGWFWN